MSYDLWFSPMKLFEYMASGKAVVASSVGQLAGVIQDDHNGLLVPPGDILSTAAAMQRLIEDTPLRVRLGRQAREDVMVKYSWECYLSRLDRLYAAVIERRPVYGI
jgi:glycosyltransferase involved in cell wall biosynthesis